MPLDTILLVLCGAALHATWNALVKSGTDKQLDSIMVALGASFASICALPLLPMPNAAAWPFILGSVCIHFTYYQLVGAAYRHGDIGLVYPLMRGVAPLIVATTSGAILGEHLSPVMFASVAFICAGVLTIAADFRRGHGKAIWIALANAVVISAYTYVDGVGARLAGNPVSYVLWGFIGICICLAPYALWRNGHRLLADLTHFWQRGLAGGALQVVSYGIALWAMTWAPIAIIASLRETSVLFGALIAVLVLEEPLRAARVAAALLIVTGLVLIRLQ